MLPWTAEEGDKGVNKPGEGVTIWAFRAIHFQTTAQIKPSDQPKEQHSE